MALYTAISSDGFECTATEAMVQSDDATLMRNTFVFPEYQPAVAFKEHQLSPQKLHGSYRVFSIWKFFFATSVLPHSLTYDEYVSCSDFAQYYSMMDFLKALGNVQYALPYWQYATLHVKDKQFNLFANQLAREQYSLYWIHKNFAYYRRLMA